MPSSKELLSQNNEHKLIDTFRAIHGNKQEFSHSTTSQIGPAHSRIDYMIASSHSTYNQYVHGNC